MTPSSMQPSETPRQHAFRLCPARLFTVTPEPSFSRRRGLRKGVCGTRWGAHGGCSGAQTGAGEGAVSPTWSQRLPCARWRPVLNGLDVPETSRNGVQEEMQRLLLDCGLVCDTPTSRSGRPHPRRPIAGIGNGSETRTRPGARSLRGRGAQGRGRPSQAPRFPGDARARLTRLP